MNKKARVTKMVQDYDSIKAGNFRGLKSLSESHYREGHTFRDGYNRGASQ